MKVKGLPLGATEPQVLGKRKEVVFRLMLAVSVEFLHGTFRGDPDGIYALRLPTNRRAAGMSHP